MPKLIIVRHGQSAWNLENRFTGEVDVDLTELGRKEALDAGKLLSSTAIDYAFTSVLRRAIETLTIMLDEMKIHPPIDKDKALNERNYGDLQGLNKKEMEGKFGADQVMIWRRSYDVRPPGGESLEDTYHRVLPYYQTKIEPLLSSDKNILIVAHGNSLRALMMYLEGIKPADIAHVDIPTGRPRQYTFSKKLELEEVKYLGI